MNLKFTRCTLAATVASFGLTLAITNAGDQLAQAIDLQNDTPLTLAEKLWSIPTIIDNPDADFIQKLAVTGRYQGQVYALDSNRGNFEDYDTRRLWIGGDLTIFKKLRIKADVVVDGNDFSPFYDGLYEAYATYALSESLSLNAGRREPYFTEEYGTSSKNIITLERSLLVNQIHPVTLAGGWVKGSAGAWKYDLGAYSGEIDQEFGSFEAGVGTVASLGYDFANDIDGQSSLMRLDYLYNDGDAGNEQLRPYDHAFSLNYHGDYGGAFQIHTDLLYASGLGGTSDAWGVVIMPSYQITEKLEGVFRYHWANSEGDNGLNLQSRYERKAPGLTSSFGDEYHSFYSGLNYYIYGQKLKLMTGVEYSTMSDSANDGGDFNGWTGFAGLRMYF